MTANTLERDARVGGQQLATQFDQGLVLGIGKGLVVGPFKLDPQGKIIAGLTPLETGNTGMPGAVLAGDKLRHRAITLNQKVRGYP